jgi:hypothetical protein
MGHAGREKRRYCTRLAAFAEDARRHVRSDLVKGDRFNEGFVREQGPTLDTGLFALFGAEPEIG